MKSWQIILIVILVVVVIGLLIYRAAIRSKQAGTQSTTSTTNAASSQTISAGEKQQIDSWISANGLNQYGDPADTIYAGGTPLFNEMTGEQIDKYDYIISSEVLEHVWEPEEVLVHMIDHLKDDGVMYLSTFFDDMRGQDPTHLVQNTKRYNSPDTWLAIVKNKGLVPTIFDMNGVPKGFKKR